MSLPMAPIIKLSDYRAKKRKDWLRKHDTLLSRFLLSSLRKNLHQSYGEVIYAYQDYLRNEEEAQVWDYEHLRDLIHEHLTQHLLDPVYEDLKKQRWFDAQVLSKESVLERCIRLYFVQSMSA